MSNPFSTTNNPFTQGGWRSDGEAASPTGSASPASSQSSNSSGSANSDAIVPSQSSYGVLPMSTTSGVTLGPLPAADGSQVFRFVSRGTQADLHVVSPNNTALYRARSGESVTVLSNHFGQHVATFRWPTGNEPALPAIERNGVRVRASDWIIAVPGSPGMRKMAVGRDRLLYLTFDHQRFYFRSDENLTNPPLASIGNSDSGCIISVHPSLLNLEPAERIEILNCLVIATITLQSKIFVGL